LTHPKQRTIRSLTTKKKDRFKTDRFTLHQESPGRWKVSGRDSGGKYRRIRFDAQDLSEAIQEAERLLSMPGDRLEKEPDTGEAFPQMHISDALIKAAETRNWSVATRKGDRQNCECFLSWVDKQGLTFWHELRFEHALHYQKYLMERNLAPDTIRLYLIPVRRTSAWMAANWPRVYVDFCRNLRLSRRESVSPIYQEDLGNPYLPIHGVLDFLDHLARDPERDRLTAGVALQGLVGLQLQEALRLTWEKVDLEDGTITIDGTVKNRYRIRRIPIPRIVVWILKERRSGRRPVDFVDYNGYSHAVQRELRRWNPEVSIKSKDLRNTLQTAAIDGGWYGYYVQRYVGHAPTTIGERHYHGDQGKRLIPLFREKVVSQIEAEIAKWNAPSDSPIWPSHSWENQAELHDHCTMREKQEKVGST